MGQTIITVSREFGSGGHQIASTIADRLGLKLYDKNILEHMAEKNSIGLEELHKFDEQKRFGFTRSFGGYTTSVHEHIAHIEFEYLKQKAEEGESFVVVGRCGDYILRDVENMYSIFVRADMSQKLERVMKLYHLDEQEAKKMANRVDKNRRAYHNYYSDIKWGDSRGYDLCVNSSKLGVSQSADMICDMLERYISSES